MAGTHAGAGQSGMRARGLLWKGLLACLLLSAALLRAQEVQPVPPLSARVIDRTGTLDAAQRQALEDKLARFEREHGTQIVVLLLPSTAPEDIAAYAQRVADTWKIGRREVGDGLLLVVAKEDRRVRIEVAKTLEGAIPDLAASRVINEAITPAFRAGNFAGGIDAGLERLMGLVRGEGLPPPPQSVPGTSSRDGFGLEDLAAFLFVGVPIVGGVLTAIFGRKLGSLLTGAGAGGLGALLTGSLGLGLAAGGIALLLILVMGVGAAGRRGHVGHGPVIWGGGGWGGGSSSGGGSGFSSGGGGDFGGGGASGRW